MLPEFVVILPEVILLLPRQPCKHWSLVQTGVECRFGCGNPVSEGLLTGMLPEFVVFCLKLSCCCHNGLANSGHWSRLVSNAGLAVSEGFLTGILPEFVGILAVFDGSYTYIVEYMWDRTCTVWAVMKLVVFAVLRRKNTDKIPEI
jgi:hypothetical protein